MGRNHLAQGQPDEAMPLLKKAVALDPGNAAYHFWLGVAQWSSDNQSGERQSYQAALDLDPAYLPARVYLGHNYFDAGAWQKALNQYERVLQTIPDHREALFNSALAYRQLGQTGNENAIWATYLSHYSSGTRAMRALSYLNTNGDFSFQTAIVGKERLAMRQVAFHGGGGQLTRAAEASVLSMGRKFAQRDNLILHVVVFHQGDATLAKKRAKTIKQTMLDAFPGIPRERIRLSWFDSALAQKINGREYRLSESVRFFTEPAI
jgi:tetratricopeptide (TPR) repeat protein